MTRKPYPRTKPSGVEWLGDVPEHWEVKRSDAIVSADRSQLSPEKFAERDVFHYSIPVVQETGTGQIENGDSIASAKQVIKKPVVLVSKLNPRKATICLATPQPILTLCSTEFVALNADKCELAFLAYLTRSELFRQGLDSKVQSVTRSHQRANPADIYKFWNAWPTLKNQRAIAAFLERETGRLDLLVAKKRELIERLKEKRTALISSTVTRGLPPAAARAAGLPVNPPLKPSGLDWLGEIPKHWEVVPLFRITETIQTGPFGSQLHSFDYVEGGIPLINPAHIIASRLVPDEMSAVDESTAIRLNRHRLRDGDIIMARRGEIGRCGVVGPREAGWLCGTGSLVIRLRGECIANYFAAIFSGAGFSGLLELNAVGTTMLNLNPTIVGRMLVPVPPLSEQAAIAAYLDKETAKLDALVGKVEEAVERLQEYRTALITAAVTGKIDVRSAVPDAGVTRGYELPPPDALLAAEDGVDYSVARHKLTGMHS